MVLADVEQDSLDALLLDDLAVGHLHPEGVPIERQRVLDVLDGDADVVDPVEHAPQSSLEARRNLPEPSGASASDSKQACLDTYGRSWRAARSRHRTAAGTAAATRRPTPGLRSNRGTPTITRSIASRSSTSLLSSSAASASSWAR